MSQNMIDCDFKNPKNNEIRYITDSMQFAKAYRDELQVITGGKYEIITPTLIVVRKMLP